MASANSKWDVALIDSVTEVPNDEMSTHGFTATTVNISGDRSVSILIDAVEAAYPVPPNIGELLASLDGQKATILKAATNMLGAKSLRAWQGTLFNGGRSILPKGKRKNGYRLDPDKVVLDVVPGYDVATLAARVAEVQAQFPTVTELTQERLDALPSDSDAINLVCFGRWHMSDGSRDDAAVYLVRDYDAENDIINGVLLVNPAAGGFSEHGSIYGADLLRFYAEAIDARTDLTFAQALELTYADHGEATGFALGKLAENPVAA